MRKVLALALLALAPCGTAAAQSIGQPLIMTTPASFLGTGTAGLYAMPGTATALQFYRVGNVGSTDYERATVGWSGTTFSIITAAGGTGTARTMSLELPSGGWVLTPDFRPGSNDALSLGSAAQNTAYVFVARAVQGSKSKALTDAAAAASFVRIAVPTNGFAAGRVIYTATSTDGTNILVSQGSCEFAAADTGGTVTAGAPACDTPATAYKRANTLTCTISGAVSTTNYDLQATCTDNLAGNQTVTLYYRLDMPQTNTVTPQ